MDKLKEYYQTHPNVAKWFVYCYVIFSGCFIFPLWSERFPLDFAKVYLVVLSYGIISLFLAVILGSRKEKLVYFQVSGFTIIGIICRYLLEFGEDSNTYNFTLSNIVIYIFIIPIFVVVSYHFIKKTSPK